MKKRIMLGITLIFIFTPQFVKASCYSAWNDAFEDATEEYKADLAYCDRQRTMSHLCKEEAELSYDNSIYDAGNTYHHCVL